MVSAVQLVCALRNLATLMAVSPESHEGEGLFDAVMIPRLIKVLSEGFDPARRLLLLCESANLSRIWQELHWDQQMGRAWTSKDTSVRALLRWPLQGMPLRNTLTPLRQSPHKVRRVRGAAEPCAAPRVLPEAPSENCTRSPTSVSIMD